MDISSMLLEPKYIPSNQDYTFLQHLLTTNFDFIVMRFFSLEYKSLPSPSPSPSINSLLILYFVIKRLIRTSRIKGSMKKWLPLFGESEIVIFNADISSYLFLLFSIFFSFFFFFLNSQMHPSPGKEIICGI